jgi:aldehyde dehydrogenase (NAD+)
MSNPNQNFIAGEWLAGVGEIDNVNPSDLSDTIGRYAQADDAQLQRALDAAETAQREWAKAGLERRYNVLMAIGNELIARCEELGTLLAREEGKTQPEGKGEVYRSGQFFTYYAAEALRQIGDNADSVRDGIEVDVRREPVGTVAVISPWNFPMATAVWKIAPALAFGNAVIWKPANLVPASAVVLAEIISRQDIPAGLFNLVMGSGSERHQFYRLGAGGPRHRAGRGWQFHQDTARNGFQERARDHGRRQSGRRACLRAQWRFRQYRAKVHRVVAPGRAQEHS